MTATQRKLMDALADGLPHTVEDLHALLWDEFSELSAVKAHISNLRKRLNGEDIVCRGGRYQLVRRLASPYDGKR